MAGAFRSSGSAAVSTGRESLVEKLPFIISVL
jgi:hypothetical protein